MEPLSGPRLGNRGKWPSCAGWAGAVMGVAFAGCIVGDNRCGENQVMSRSSATSCMCAEGAVPDPRGYGCVKCGAHERVVQMACACERGYARPSAGAACEQVPGSVLGDACDEATPCTEPNPYCAPRPDGSGFCTTQGCTTSAACPMDHRCVKTATTSYCELPTGLNDACTGHADCTGQASFCDNFITDSCFLDKCAIGENACPNGYVCCDLQALIATSLCISRASLVEIDGKCPGGGNPLPEEGTRDPAP